MSELQAKRGILYNEVFGQRVSSRTSRHHARYCRQVGEACDGELLPNHAGAGNTQLSRFLMASYFSTLKLFQNDGHGDMSFTKIITAEPEGLATSSEVRDTVYMARARLLGSGGYSTCKAVHKHCRRRHTSLR